MLRAQRRVRPLLGEQLYTELVVRKKAESLSDDWLELHSKAIPALVYAAAAQYWPFSQTMVTRNSLVRKESQQSEPIDARTLAAQAAIYDGEALGYEAELRSWLISKATSFIEFYPDASRCGSHAAPARTATVVVQAIGRPAYRPR
ncbi:hypothetical protein DNI29_19185 [Hymenobacter sediminis]|uniref:DUF6712 family protein n=1 Tax=Hymenobacter sediminis TaxID=2218621 RepID=UPI000DA6A095|nr:hypothetical protein [Hymenobacter sediminis]RPD44834.1 hypothetical protein DNI29_19185 [Hymenobacter sediminis]